MTSVTPPDSHYVRIAGELRQDIVGHVLSPRDKLPSERDLCLRFCASRVTVRRALRVLEDERLIVRKHGSGTYVSAQPQRCIPLMIDYTGSMRDHAPQLQRQVLLWRWEQADNRIAEDLKIEERSEVLYAERVDRQNDRVVACDRAYFVASFARDLTEKHLGRVDFVETWTRSCHFEVESCRQTIEAVAANTWISHRLEVRPNRPVLRSTEIYCSLHDRPAGLFESFYDPDHICIALRYRWSNAMRSAPISKESRL